MSQLLAPPSRIDSITIERRSEGVAMRLVLLPIESVGTLQFEFDQVLELRFRGDSVELGLVVRLLVEDVSSHGMEKVRFRVSDAEEEFISFSCMTVTSGDLTAP